MKTSKILAACLGAAVLVVAGAASAQEINKSTHLSNTGNTAVNNVKAKQYLMRDQSGQGGQDADGNQYDPATDTLVHMGSAKKGDCNMNVGGTKAGPGGKEVVVTAKNIINVCK